MFKLVYVAVWALLTVASFVYFVIGLQVAPSSYLTLYSYPIGLGLLLFGLAPLYVLAARRVRRERSVASTRSDTSGSAHGTYIYGGGARTGAAHWSSGGYDPGSGGGSSGGGGYAGGGL